MGIRRREEKRAENIFSFNFFKGYTTLILRSKHILQRLDRAEERRPLSSMEFALMIKLRIHIYDLTVLLETKWKQRTSINWLKQGDRSSKYFHSVASARQSANHIPRVITDDGQTHSTTQEIPAEFSSFYKQLLGSPPPDTIGTDLSDLYRDHQNPSLDLTPLSDPITSNEIRKAVFSLPKGKAAGPDGWHIEFFQTY